MEANEIKAVMDVVKIGIQSMMAFFFAVLVLAIQGEPVLWEVYFLLVLAGVVGFVMLIRKYKYLGRELDNVERERHVRD